MVLPQTQNSSASTTTTTTTTAESTTSTEATTTQPVSTTTSSSAADTTTTTTETTVTATETTPQNDTAEYLFDALSIGGDCTAYVAQHTDYSLQEAPSCMGEGTDRVYTYGDYVLYTFFDGTVDMVQEINLTGESIKTRLGASLGMTQAEVEALYGTSADGTYQTQDGVMEFTYADNTVILIAVFNPL